MLQQYHSYCKQGIEIRIHNTGFSLGFLLYAWLAMVAHFCSIHSSYLFMQVCLFMCVCNILCGRIKGFCRAIYLIFPCFEGNIRYIALKPGQYLDIAWKGGFWPAFDQSIDLSFDMQGTIKKTSFLI